MTQLYRMHDAEPRGVVRTTPSEALAWNTPERGHGVFATLNQFDGPRRIQNLRRIRAWAVDMDEGTKDEQRERILGSPLIPSTVVETKRGYQVHWHAKDGTKRHWDALVLERLVPWFGADKNARDIARILRVPGYVHLKNPAEPFLVRTVHRWDVAYTERQIAEHFPHVPREGERERRESFDRDVAPARIHTSGDAFWERVYAMDCGGALLRISGHPAVSGEQYTLRTVHSGNRNVIVDGKSSSCFVDTAGNIGSLSGGGPSMYQWLSWLGHSPRECVRVLKEVYPELVEASS